MWNKLALAAVAGAIAGSVGTSLWMWPRESAFTTMAQCVLAEMKGRQLEMKPWAVKACQERAPAMTDEEVFGATAGSSQ